MEYLTDPLSRSASASPNFPWHKASPFFQETQPDPCHAMRGHVSSCTALNWIVTAIAVDCCVSASAFAGYPEGLPGFACAGHGFFRVPPGFCI
ncbi:MAG TPA: hypothetical protein VGC24_09855 [Burkholderiaceae bacterium]